MVRIVQDLMEGTALNFILNVKWDHKLLLSLSMPLRFCLDLMYKEQVII